MTWNRAQIQFEKIARGQMGADLDAAWISARTDLVTSLGAVFDVKDRAPASTVFSNPKSPASRLLVALAESHLREGAASFMASRKATAAKYKQAFVMPALPLRAKDSALEDVFLDAVRADAPGAALVGMTCERELVAEIEMGGSKRWELAVVPFLKATLEAHLAKVLPRAMAPVSEIPPALAAAMRGGEFFQVPQPGQAVANSLPNGLVELPVDEIVAGG